MSNNRKGREAENLAVQLLQDDGYVTHRTFRTPYHHNGKWGSHRNDVLGCVDIIAIRGDKRPRWIQVTMSRAVGRKIAAFEGIPWNPEHNSVEIWILRKPTKKFPQRAFLIYHLDTHFQRRFARVLPV